MTSFLRHEYPDMPVMSEPCRYFMPSAHDNVGDYGNSLDQCRYYGMITRSHNVRSLAPTDSCIIVLRTFPGKLTFRETSVDRFTDPFSGLGNANSPMCVSVLV